MEIFQNRFILESKNNILPLYLKANECLVLIKKILVTPLKKLIKKLIIKFNANYNKI
jgi:hypothetical protein